MAALSDDQHAAMGILALVDALEEQNETRAMDSRNSARKHAYAILRHYKHNQRPAGPEACLCQPDRRPYCDCNGVCICDVEPIERTTQ